MLTTLRATPLKSNEIVNDYFLLKKNTPKLINKKNNSHVIQIHEDSAGEDCYIHSSISGNAFAHIGNEFCLNFMKNPKKVDLSYYFFPESKLAVVYLYDMKATFAGKNVLLHLIEQWKSSIADAKYCINVVDEYQLAERDIHIGVITENNDESYRKRELKSIRKQINETRAEDGIASFVQYKHKAAIAELVKCEKILSEIEGGKITIDGVTYSIDIRQFEEKVHNMYFRDGVLDP